MRFLLILATSFTSLFSFFELVIIALLESRQSMWAAITLLVYITFLTKCVKCQTQNIMIILLNYVCKWDFIVSILMASKNLDILPPWIWRDLICCVLTVYKINLPIFDSFHLTEITWFLLYMASISDTVEWNYHLLFRINIMITVLFYRRLFYASEYFVIFYNFCV